MAENSHLNSHSGRRRTDPEQADHLYEYRFQPGRSGNPGGRPKRKFTAALHRVVNMRVKDLEIKPEDRLPLAMLKRWAQAGLNGNLSAIVQMANLADGPIPQQEADGVYGYGMPAGDDPRMEILYGALRVAVERTAAYRIPLPKLAEAVLTEEERREFAAAGLLEGETEDGEKDGE